MNHLLLKIPFVSIVSLLSAAPTLAQGPTPPAAMVEVATAELMPIAPQRWVPGSVVSRDDARLATSAAGRLEFVAEVGTHLKAGELVARLEDRAARLRLEDARSEVARIKAQRELAQRQSDRLQSLVASNSIAANQLDEARAQVTQLEAQQRQSEVRVHTAAYELEQTKVVAQFPGVVTERLAQRGEYAGTGAAIVHLVDVTHLEARVQAPLALSSLVKSGMPLTIRAGDKMYNERVRSVVAVGDERSRQFELRVALPSGELPVGSAIEVSLPERKAENTLAVPRDALVERAEGSYVVRISSDGNSERVNVRVSARDGEFMAVDGALEPGDQVVVRGAERLTAGQKVQIAGAVSGGGKPTASMR
jgi:RND family efflux transporter MFP subunit